MFISFKKLIQVIRIIIATSVIEENQKKATRILFLKI